MSASILLSVLAASLALPQPGSSFSTAALAPRSGSGVAIVKLFVAPDRKVEDCQILGTDFDDDDNERVCASLRNKRAAKPAAGPDGKPMYGMLTYIVSDNDNPRPLPLRSNIGGDFVLDVESLPGDSRSLKVVLLMDEAGKVTSCEGSTAMDGNLAKVACDELRTQSMDVRHDRDGKAVAYVEQITVDFVERQAGL